MLSRVFLRQDFFKVSIWMWDGRRDSHKKMSISSSHIQLCINAAKFHLCDKKTGIMEFHLKMFTRPNKTKKYALFLL